MILEFGASAALYCVLINYLLAFTVSIPKLTWFMNLGYPRWHLYFFLFGKKWRKYGGQVWLWILLVDVGDRFCWRCLIIYRIILSNNNYYKARKNKYRDIRIFLKQDVQSKVFNPLLSFCHWINHCSIIEIRSSKRYTIGLCTNEDYIFISI